MTEDPPSRPQAGGPGEIICAIPSDGLLEALRDDRMQKLARGEALELWPRDSPLAVPPYCLVCGEYLPSGKRRCPTCDPHERELDEWRQRKQQAYRKAVQIHEAAKRRVNIFFGILTVVTIPTVLGAALCVIVWLLVLRGLDADAPRESDY